MQVAVGQYATAASGDANNPSGSILVDVNECIEDSGDQEWSRGHDTSITVV